MDKNIIAALIIGATILLHPLVEDSTKDYKWRLTKYGGYEYSGDGIHKVYWFYSEKECEKHLAYMKSIDSSDGESCRRFPR